MSIVFVLTDKGWKDEQSLKSGDGVYCFDPKCWGLDFTTIDEMVDVSNQLTYKLVNRQTNYTAYVNQDSHVHIVNDLTNVCYPSDINSVTARYLDVGVYIPCSFKCVTDNVRQTSPHSNTNFARQVKMRDIGLVDFDMSPAYARQLIDAWKTQYQRLNAVDYNQASMIQMVALKGGYCSKIEPEIGFVVKVIDVPFVRVTDIKISDSVKINRHFYHNGIPISVVRLVDGQVMIG